MSVTQPAEKGKSRSPEPVTLRRWSRSSPVTSIPKPLAELIHKTTPGCKRKTVQCTELLQLFQLFVMLWTVAHQAPLLTKFSRQEFWNGLPCPPPGDLPNPGNEPVSLTSPALAGSFFTQVLHHLGSPNTVVEGILMARREYILDKIRASCLKCKGKYKEEKPEINTLTNYYYQ